MVGIDFGNFPENFSGVNMNSPGALGQAILQDFATFNFNSGLFDPIEGIYEIPNHVIPESITAFVLAQGSFEFNGGIPTDNSRVFGIEVWVLGASPGTFVYRLVVIGLDVSYGQLKGALLAKNLAPLWEGEALLIHGHANLPDTLAGGALDDEIYGYGGDDILTGGGGDDYLDGQQGRDTMAGGAGDDDYGVSNSRDVIDESGGEGKDLVIASANYRLPDFVEDIALFGSNPIDGTGNALANYMEGNPAANELRGLAGNDTLTGLGGNDLLGGGDGSDNLVGGNGADILRGGNGNDLLTWDSADSAVNGGAGIDTLRVSGSLDLLNVDNGTIVDIERIRLAGGGANTLTLSRSDILDISSTTNALRILGEAGDTVNAPNNFVETGAVDGYTRYRAGAATLWIDSDIAVV